MSNWLNGHPLLALRAGSKVTMGVNHLKGPHSGMFACFRCFYLCLFLMTCSKILWCFPFISNWSIAVKEITSSKQGKRRTFNHFNTIILCMKANQLINERSPLSQRFEQMFAAMDLHCNFIILEWSIPHNFLFWIRIELHVQTSFYFSDCGELLIVEGKHIFPEEKHIFPLT